MISEFFLIGDSHAHSLHLAAKQAGFAYRGRTIGSGLSLHTPFCRAEGTDFILYRPEHQDKADMYRDLLRFDGPILSTIGFNTHHFSAAYLKYLNQRKIDFQQISAELFHNCVYDASAGAIEFYQLLHRFNRQVYFTLSPQRFTARNQKIYENFEMVLSDRLESLGAIKIDVRPATTDENGLREEFKSPEDAVHANSAYGALVLDRLR